jgi:hypothetical protein
MGDCPVDHLKDISGWPPFCLEVTNKEGKSQHKCQNDLEKWFKNL